MSTTSIRIAAVQMRGKVAVVDYNLAQAESLAREAFRRGAQWIVLPEFFPTAMAFTPAMLAGWRPLEGAPLEFMRRLAREGDGIVGGSFIAKHGADCFNSFLLVFPDGTYRRHDKDIPTMWENCYYVGGSDDGVLETPVGPVGVALCWELLRTQTARRLVGKVGLVVGGSCWWGPPLPLSAERAADWQEILRLHQEAPSRLARMLGVPVVNACHAGRFEGQTPGDETRPYVSHFLGETRIVDGRGTVLARLGEEHGEGVILGDLTPGPLLGGRDPIPSEFWTADLPPRALKAWETMRTFGEDYYRSTTRPSL
jgi:predicted amidohydrolase